MQKDKPRAAQAEISDKLKALMSARVPARSEPKKSRREQVREAQRYVPGKRGMGRRGIS